MSRASFIGSVSNKDPPVENTLSSTSLRQLGRIALRYAPCSKQQLLTMLRRVHFRQSWILTALLLSLFISTIKQVPGVQASESLLHAVANHAQRQKGAPTNLARPDWRLYHRTDELLLRLRALAAHCPHAHAQNIILEDDQHDAQSPAHGNSGHSVHDSHHLVPESAVKSLSMGSERKLGFNFHNVHPTAQTLRGGQHSILVITLAMSAAERKYEKRDRGLTLGQFPFGSSRYSSKSGSNRAEKWPNMPQEAAKRLRILATFGEHGREFISAEIALKLVERVCAPSSPDFSETARDQLLHELHRTELVLVPLVGEASRKLAESGRFCERLNGRGVDINRNFGHSWGLSDKNTNAEEERPGHTAFSEFEARAVHVLARHLQPHAYISVHSGGQAIVTPWDHSGELPNSAIVQNDLKRIADVLRGTHCPMCQIGTAEKLFGYRAFGTGVDFMHGILHVPITLTLEVYGDDDASHDDCVRFFNPVTASTYKDTIDNWSQAFETLSVAIHDLKSIRIHLNSSSSSLSSSGRSDGWAFVASRLGHSAWTTTAYRASIHTDDFVAPAGDPSFAHGRGKLDRMSFGGLSSLLQRKSATHRLDHAHPVLSFVSALIALCGFITMVLVAKYLTRNRRRHVAVGRGILPSNGPGSSVRRFRPYRGTSSLTAFVKGATTDDEELPRKSA